MTVGNLNDLSNIAHRLHKAVEAQQNALADLQSSLNDYQDLLLQMLKENRELQEEINE